MLSAVIAVGITKAIGGAASSNGGGAPSAGTSAAGGIGAGIGAFGLSAELQLGLATAGMTIAVAAGAAIQQASENQGSGGLPNNGGGGFENSGGDFQNHIDKEEKKYDVDEWDEYLDDEMPQSYRIGRQNKNTPRSNQKQNVQVDKVVKELNLNKKQRRQLHNEISHQGYGYREILNLAKELFGLE